MHCQQGIIDGLLSVEFRAAFEAGPPIELPPVHFKFLAAIRSGLKSAVSIRHAVKKRPTFVPLRTKVGQQQQFPRLLYSPTIARPRGFTALPWPRAMIVCAPVAGLIRMIAPSKPPLAMSGLCGFTV
jgi:hypothetical protein